MTQLLSTLLGVPQTTTANPLASATPENAASASFADALGTALGDAAVPEAALLAQGVGLVGLLATSTATSTLTDAVLDSSLALANTADDGKSSPQSGSDLPLELQLLDTRSVLQPVLSGTLAAAHDTQTQGGSDLPLELQLLAANGALSPGLGNTAEAADDAQPQRTPPDLTANDADPNLALLDVVTQSGLQTAQWPATALPSSGRVTALPPGTARIPASTPDTVSVLVADSLESGAVPLAATLNTQVQTAGQAPQAQSRHTSKDLELLTSFASVLMPVKADSVERFELPAAAMSTPVMSDATTAGTGASPLNSSGVVAPNVVAPSSAILGKADLAIPQAPGQPGWGEVFADRVGFAVRQSMQEAEIRLNPPHLGQVDIRIVMNNDQANLIFGSPHAAVRDAIEASVGRLRDMLADSGFNLVNVDVSDKSLAQQRDARGQRESGQTGSQAQYRADFMLAASAQEVVRGVNISAIDYYV
ncbi:MAG: flagellar hook-length control protein FliK [Gammaproteobacteria bacterium]|nr:flagellar hook-length control protein FliK [Gammaproteobacteria bacterium]